MKGQEMAGMRIVFVLGTSAGGVGRHVRAMAGGLAVRGANVAVVGPAATDEAFGFSAVAAFRAVEISDRPRPAADLRVLAQLRRRLRGADVVHAHGLRAGGLAALALTRAVPGPLRLAPGGPPLLVTLHNAAIAGGMTGAAYRTLERVVARGAAMVLGVSPDLEERMRDLGARSVGHALVPAPLPDREPDADAARRIRVELGAGDRPVLLTVARLADQKGLPTLLDAAAILAQRSVPPLIVIAGGGPLEAPLRRRIDAEMLPVRLLGPRNDVPDLLAAADVAVVPSVWEGQPLVIQEALRAGLPMVVTGVGGIPGMVGDAAILIPQGEAEQLARAVGSLLDDPELAKRLAALAAVRARSLPGEDDAVAQLAECYQKLTA